MDRRILSRLRAVLVGVGSLVIVGLLVLTIVNPSKLVLTASATATPLRHAHPAKGKEIVYGRVVGVKGKPVFAEVLVYRQIGRRRVLIYKGTTHTKWHLYRLQLATGRPLFVQFAVKQSAKSKPIYSHLVRVKEQGHFCDVSGVEHSSSIFFVLPVSAY